MAIDDPTTWLRLSSPRLTACIDPIGAQLVVLRDAHDRDLLWNGDPRWWSGRAPLLFPIVGELAEGHYRWDGREYSLSRHGFARGLPFDVAHSDAGSVVLLLRASDATRRVYPFEFTLRIAFTLSASKLEVVATVRNTGEGLLPASLGFHPAFRWPIDASHRESHWIEFASAEPAPVRRLDAAGLLRADAVPTPVRGRRLDLRDDLFAEDALIFDRLSSRQLTYGTADTRLTVGFPDASHLGLWTKPGAGFLCIEPWRGVADPQGWTGDFQTKPGLVHVAPGDEASLTMDVSLDA